MLEYNFWKINTNLWIKLLMCDFITRRLWVSAADLSTITHKAGDYWRGRCRCNQEWDTVWLRDLARLITINCWSVVSTHEVIDRKQCMAWGWTCMRTGKWWQATWLAVASVGADRACSIAGGQGCSWLVFSSVCASWYPPWYLSLGWRQGLWQREGFIQQMSWSCQEGCLEGA